MKDQQIKAAAWKVGGTVYSLPKPARHHNIRDYLIRWFKFPPPITGPQGFLLEDDTFIERKPAGEMALRTGQISKMISPPTLTSEDLW